MAVSYNQTGLTDNSQDLLGTQQLQKPKAPTGSALTDPMAPGATIPLAGSAPSQPLAPSAPHPLGTSDPLAFQPQSSTPYKDPTSGQTFIGGTQTTDPATGKVTSPGVLGNQFVPGTNNGLIDLGGGNVAPTVNGQGAVMIGAPLETPGYQPPGTVTAQGKIVGMTYDANGNPTPVYDHSVSDPNVQTTQASAPTTQDMLNLFQATERGLVPPGASAPAGYAVKTTDLPGMLAGSTPSPSAANGTPVTPGAAPAPTGPANGVGTPSSGLGTTLPMAGLPGGVSQSVGAPTGTPGASGAAPGAAPTGAPPAMGAGVGLTPTTSDNALTNYTISPNNTVDRVGLAQKSLQSTIQNVLDPEFQANLRDANRYSFGAGRGVSGLARTRTGDITSDYNRQKANLTDTLLNNATTGSIEDLYRNIGIAQQQQAFQQGQQGTAFGQNMAVQDLADRERQQAFSEALQQMLTGSSGDPSQIALVLSQIFGGQAGQAGQAASNYAGSQQTLQSQQQLQQQMQDLLEQLYGNSAMNNILGQGVPGVQMTPGAGYIQ